MLNMNVHTSVPVMSPLEMCLDYITPLHEYRVFLNSLLTLIHANPW